MWSRRQKSIRKPFVGQRKPFVLVYITRKIFSDGKVSRGKFSVENTSAIGCLPRCYFNDEMVATLEECFVAVLNELFSKTCVEPREIDILIVNVSTNY
jgi:hypothetical protein